MTTDELIARTWMRSGNRALALLMTLLSGCGSIAEARPERAELPSFDFKVISESALWYSVNVVSLTPGPEGLVIQIANGDPQLFGPEREFPANQPLWLHLRLKSEQGGDAQVFYFQEVPAREADSVHFQVPAGQWYEAVVALPPLAGRWRLRLDPPGDHGLCILDRLWLEERLALPAPPKPKTGALESDALILRAGDRELAHAGTSGVLFAAVHPSARFRQLWHK